MNVRHLKQVNDAQDDSLVQETLLDLRELENNADESRQVLFRFCWDLENVL